MKKYDFETVINREGTGSSKWDEIKNTLGYTPDGIIPFSVADSFSLMKGISLESQVLVLKDGIWHVQLLM